MGFNYNFFLVYLAVMASFVLYVSCQAGVENKGGQSTSFVNKSWKLQSLSVSPAIDWDLDGKKETDIFALMEDCEKDDLLVLRNDHIILRNAGKVKCDEEDDQEKQTGVWSYDKASQKLVLKEDGKAQEIKVIESGASRLKLSYKWNTTDGKPHAMTAIYVIK